MTRTEWLIIYYGLGAAAGALLAFGLGLTSPFSIAAISASLVAWFISSRRLGLYGWTLETFAWLAIAAVMYAASTTLNWLNA